MAEPSSYAIEARGLTKRFGDVLALDGLDLNVPEGTVLGLLGPNGAGKTTAVSILTTLLTLDSGSATIAGADLATEPQLIRERIGLSGQYAAVDEILTGRENLQMVGRLYHMGKKGAAARASELLERFMLSDAADRPVKGYSGGMRRRLDLAGALMAAPPVLFLDEPTTGLDPRSRIELWAVIRELVADGATLLLTTQYLEEADQLADNIIVIDQGKAIAEGTSDELKASLGSERLEVVVAEASDLERGRVLLEKYISDDQPVDVSPAVRALHVTVGSGIDSLAEVIDDLKAERIAVSDIGLRRPTLDDVFLTLTGHDTSESTDAAEEAS